MVKKEFLLSRFWGQVLTAMYTNTKNSQNIHFWQLLRHGLCCSISVFLSLTNMEFSFLAKLEYIDTISYHFTLVKYLKHWIYIKGYCWKYQTILIFTNSMSEFKNIFQLNIIQVDIVNIFFNKFLYYFFFFVVEWIFNITIRKKKWTVCNNE